VIYVTDTHALVFYVTGALRRSGLVRTVW